MINVMRKHHKALMIVITALVCISFSWYWNKTDFAQMGQGAIGRIYNRNVSQLEFQLSAGVHVPEGEMRSSFEQAYSKMEVSVVRLRTSDFNDKTDPTDDEISKYFEAHKAELKTEEKRKV